MKIEPFCNVLAPLITNCLCNFYTTSSLNNVKKINELNPDRCIKTQLTNTIIYIQMYRLALLTLSSAFNIGFTHHLGLQDRTDKVFTDLAVALRNPMECHVDPSFRYREGYKNVLSLKIGSFIYSFVTQHSFLQPSGLRV